METYYYGRRQVIKRQLQLAVLILAQLQPTINTQQLEITC